MKIAVIAGLPAKRDMYINACQRVCDLMNTFKAPSNFIWHCPGKLTAYDKIKTANMGYGFFIVMPRCRGAE